MDESVEVVICHDILAVPCEDSTRYVWAATQTFTIKHLHGEGAASDTNNVVSVNGDSGFSDGETTSTTARPEDYSNPTPNWNAGIQHGLKPNKVVTDRADRMSPRDLESVSSQTAYQAELSNKDGNGFMSAFASFVSENYETEDRSKRPRVYNEIEPGTFCCGMCDEVFESLDEMHTHRINHFGYSWKHRLRACGFCDMEFTSLEEFSDHLYAYHPDMHGNGRVRYKANRKKPRRNHQEPSHSSLTSESSNLPSKPEFFPADSLENTQNPSQSLITAEPDPQIQHQIFPTTNNDRLAYVTPPNNLVITS
ncbi:unnamed protein product [Hermetia illucens]|uniref:C2H2-type domain-containing protein n=2 Tax=Hermetia illucens TaxID=343691 RepID=A0A7R8YW50_HERIL|nr:unnamed protein product [Hermetia illucens]